MKKLLVLIVIFTLGVGLFAGTVWGQNQTVDSAKKDTRQSLSDDELYDKVYGSLYGKLIGLVLGQPVEGSSKDRIEGELRKLKAYPLEYYWPANFETPHKKFLQGNIDGAPANDDTTLMMASLLALRNNGIDVTARNIAQAWVDYVGGGCTAEGVALTNLKKGLWPPECALVDNPYRQWIGAQMRADIWGMIAPGMPKAAAHYAKQDAVVTHIRNGIYGAQFLAAAVSIAMVENDPHKIVTRALQVVPPNTEYARVIKDALACFDEGKSWEQAWLVLDQRYGFNDDGTRDGDFPEDKYNTKKGLYTWSNLRWVHVIPNGGACALAILYGKGDFSRSICLATMAGYDADCNAGSVGGVIGAMIGESKIPEKWKGPIHDDFYPGLPKGLPETVKISALAKEIAGYARQVEKAQQKKSK